MFEPLALTKIGVSVVPVHRIYAFGCLKKLFWFKTVHTDGLFQQNEIFEMLFVAKQF